MEKAKLLRKTLSWWRYIWDGKWCIWWTLWSWNGSGIWADGRDVPKCSESFCWNEHALLRWSSAAILRYRATFLLLRICKFYMAVTPHYAKIIGIFNGCEVLIENSVTRVTVRHHEACRDMTVTEVITPCNSRINLHRRTIMDTFSCILFFRQLHLDLNMCCFINLR